MGQPAGYVGNIKQDEKHDWRYQDILSMSTISSYRTFRIATDVAFLFAWMASIGNGDEGNGDEENGQQRRICRTDFCGE